MLHHGFLDHARSWDPVAEILCRSFRVLAVDARGHGDSQWLRGGGYYYFQDYVFDMADVLDTLVEGPVVLVGHSMGGMVCSLFSGAFPERVDALVSIEGAGPPGMSPSDAPGMMAAWIEGVRRFLDKPARTLADIEEAAGRLRTYNPRISEAFSLHLAVHGTRKAPGGNGVTWKYDPVHRTRGPQPFYLEQARAFWERFRGPTLVVRGAESPFRWDPAEDRECMQVRTRVEIPGAGHMVHHEQPERLAQEILAFLETAAGGEEA